MRQTWGIAYWPIVARNVFIPRKMHNNGNEALRTNVRF
jgi:hypothetical protein